MVSGRASNTSQNIGRFDMGSASAALLVMKSAWAWAIRGIPLLRSHCQSIFRIPLEVHSVTLYRQKVGTDPRQRQFRSTASPISRADSQLMFWIAIGHKSDWVVQIGGHPRCHEYVAG